MSFRINRGIWQFKKEDGTFESKYKIATDGRIVETDASGNELSTFGGSIAWSAVTDKPSTFTPSAHTHDDRYYTESEVNTLLAGKQASGSYITSNAALTAITTGAWAGAAGYHGYTYTGGNYRFGFSSTSGVVDVYADGNFYAQEGAKKLATEEYVTTRGYITSSSSITGNAASATILQTTRTINGTNFNGSGNITTSTWGTARTITIGNTGKSVNGGGNVSWSLGEIGAQAEGHINAAYIDFTVGGDANTYYIVRIPGSAVYGFQRYSISRGYSWTAPDTWNTSTHRGGLTFSFEWSGDTAWGGNDKSIRVVEFGETYSTMVAGMALPVTGGVIVWLRGGGAQYRLHAPSGASASVTVEAGNFTAGNGAVFTPRTDTSNVTAEIYGRWPVRNDNELYVGTNAVIHAGNIGSQSVNYAASSGSTSGNAATATKLQTARSIALGGDVSGSANFDGSGNITITATVADDSHNHVISNIDGLQAALDGKQASGSYAAASHDHNGVYLPIGGKAADAETVDGIDSSRIVYGEGVRKSTSYSTMDSSTDNVSGFFFYNNPTGNPFNDWTHWINCIGNSWSNNYGYQLAHAFHSDSFAVRRVTNGSFGSWRTVIDSGNIGSQSVNYATTAGSANAVAWGNVSGKPSTFTPSSHTHAISDVTGLQTALDGKQAAGSYLTTSGKAADSNLLDGIDSSGFQRQIDESIVNIASPNESSGTWTNGDADDWGTPRIGSIAARYNDGTGYLQFNVPAGMDSAYISHLTWSSGGYVDCYGVQADGGLVFLRRINTRQSIENTNEGSNGGNPNQHDGSTITLVGTGLSSFSAIRLQNRVGRFHLTGMSFTSAKLQGTEGTGMVHPGQLSVSGNGSGLDADLLDGNHASAFALSSHTHTISNITGLQSALDGKQAAGSYLTGNQTITLSGDVGGSGTTSIAVTVNNIDGWGFVNTGSNSATNADTINSNGISYYTGGVTNFSGNATDGALYSQRYSDSWQHQIAGDYRSGQIALRGKNNGTWQAWRTVLDSSNFSSWAAAASHTHTIANVTGLQTALDGKQAAGSYAAASHTHDDRYYTETESDGRFLKLAGGTTTGTVVMNGDNYLNGSLSSIKNIHYQYSGIGYTVTNGAAAWYRIAKLDNFGAGILILGFTNNGAINEVIYEITYWLGEGDNATIDLRKFGVDDYVTEARIVKNNSLYYIEAYFAAAPTTPQTYHSPEIFNVRTLGTNINKVITVYTGNLSVTSGTQTTLVGKAFIDNGNTFSVENATSTLAGLAVHSGRNNEANKIVRTQGNGYVDFGWINTTSGNTTATISDVYVNTNDGYIRKATPAHFRSQITDGVYAPVSHTHTIANIDGLQAALDGKQASGSYAAASHTHTFASLTSKPTTISGYGITDAITTGNIGSQSVSRASGVSITGFGTDSFTYHQTPGNVHNWTGGWASHFIGNHGNGDTYYSQSIIMPFWSVPRYQRNEGGNKVGPWQFITEENIATQSVSFATTSGSATSSTTANRLDNYGINYGSDWNTWGVYGKLVASSYHNASGANKPPTYNYGSFLSFLNSGSDSFQIAIPENQWDGTGKQRAMHYRSGWNGTWSSWRQVVDIQNNVCDILADGNSTLIVRQGVGYNSPFNSNIEIHGSVDDWAYGKFRFRVQDDPGSIPVYGAQFRIERFSVNTGWQLLGMVPRGSQNLEWQGDILPGLSDQRVKENVVSLTDGVATVQQINPVEFDWKPVENVSEREGHDIGFIAQQLEEIVPTAVHTRSDGYKTVKYEKVVPILVQAIKEQQSMIEQLTARIEALENK